MRTWDLIFDDLSSIDPLRVKYLWIKKERRFLWRRKCFVNQVYFLWELKIYLLLWLIVLHRWSFRIERIDILCKLEYLNGWENELDRWKWKFNRWFCRMVWNNLIILDLINNRLEDFQRRLSLQHLIYKEFEKSLFSVSIEWFTVVVIDRIHWNFFVFDDDVRLDLYSLWMMKMDFLLFDPFGMFLSLNMNLFIFLSEKEMNGCYLKNKYPIWSVLPMDRSSA